MHVSMHFDHCRCLQRKGALLRRGKPSAVSQRLPSSHGNALKGYSLPADGTTDAPVSPAQHGGAERAQQAHLRPSGKRKPAVGHEGSAGTTPGANEAVAVSSVALEPAGAATHRQLTHGPANGHDTLANGGSENAAQRLTGKKRKLVGAAQQAGIVSGILAQREPARKQPPAGAQAGMSFKAVSC